MDFLIKELFRLTQPGRMTSIHCMNLPTSKTHHGYIGIRDFRGEIIRAFEKAGWIFHSEVCIWKDPVTAMQRTNASLSADPRVTGKPPRADSAQRGNDICQSESLPM